jgi:hypothetical protein
VDYHGAQHGPLRIAAPQPLAWRTTWKNDGPQRRRPTPVRAPTTPIGALLVVGFLTLTIMVTWYGMFALNVVRN